MSNDSNESSRTDGESSPAPNPHEDETVTRPPMTETSDGQRSPIANSIEDAPRIDGYRITGRLGEGGMGTVWRAEQLSTKREVALKLMSGRMFGSNKALIRFEREVELAASLEHPNIARVYDSGVQGGTHYYALEVLDGLPLDDYALEHQLSEKQRVALMQKVCKAVEVAHQRGVIHRDLKPSNILVTKDGEPHVLDFGLAKSVIDDTHDVTMTQEGEIAGTPAYMAPEQAAGRVSEMDTRTDVYALGAILYRMLTGSQPHEMTGSRLDVLRRIAEDEIRRPRFAAPSLNGELESILIKALERDRGERYGSAGSLARELKRYLDGDPISARPATATYFLRKRIVKHKPWFVAAFLAFALFNGAVIFYFWSIKAEQKRTENAKTIAEANAAEAAIQARLAKDNETLARDNETLAKDNEAAALEQTRRAVDAEADAKAKAEEAQRNLYFNQIALASRELESGRVTRCNELLSECREDLRGWEWHYLRKRCDVRPTALRGIAGVTESVAWSPDGQHIVAGNRAGVLKVWDVRTRRVVTTYEEHAGKVMHCLFATNGEWIASAAGKMLHVWNPTTGEKIRVFEFDEAIRGLALSGNGSRLAAGLYGREVQIIDCQDWNVLKTLPVRISKIHSRAGLALDSTGKRIAITEEIGITIWDVANSERLATVTKGSGGTHALSFSPDGRFLYGSFKGGWLHAWELPTGEPVWNRYAGDLHALSPDGQLIAATRWKTVEIFRASDGVPVTRYRQQTGHNFWQPTFSPDSQFVAVASPEQVAIWPASPPKASKLLPHSRGLAATIDVDSTGLLLAGSGRDRVGIWNLHQEQRVWSVPFLSPWDTHGALISSDRKRFDYIGHGGRVFSRSLESGKLLIEANSGIGNPHRARLFRAQEGQVGIWSGDGGGSGIQFTFLDEGKWTETSARPVKGGNAGFAYCKPTGMICMPVGQSIELYKPSTPEPAHRINIGERVLSAAFSPDGRWLLLGCGPSRPVCMVDVANARIHYRLFNHDDAVAAVAWSPDGKRFVTAGRDTKMAIRDAKTGREILTIPMTGSLSSVAFTPDGSTLIAGNGAGFHLLKGTPSSVRAGQAIDLLSNVNTTRDRRKGRWHIDGVLHCDTTREARSQGKLRIPVTIEGSYRIPVAIEGSYRTRLKLTRRSGIKMIAVILPVKDRHALLALDRGTDHSSGIGMIAGMGASDAGNPSRITGHSLNNGQEYLLDVQVVLVGDDVEITSWLDGKPHVTWTGPIGQLKTHPNWVSEKYALSLGSGVDNIVAFSQLDLHMLDGYAVGLAGDFKGVSPAASPGIAVGAVDILKAISPKDHVESGDWWLEDGILVSDQSKPSQIIAPISINGRYTVDIEFKRRKGVESFSVQLPLGAHSFLFLIDGFRQHLGGFDRIDGEQVNKNPTRFERALKNDTWYHLKISVITDIDKVNVEAKLDNQVVAQWQGPAKQLANANAFRSPRIIGIQTWESEYAIRRAVVRSLGGSIRRVEDLLPSDPKIWKVQNADKDPK